METQVLVHVDLDGRPVLVGRLWARMRKGRDSASFEYDDSWLERDDRFALEPALQPGPGASIPKETERFLAESATRPPIAGDGCSCAGPSADARKLLARHPEPCGKLITCCK
jgi:hypothetical protein